MRELEYTKNFKKLYKNLDDFILENMFNIDLSEITEI